MLSGGNIDPELTVREMEDEAALSQRARCDV